MAMVGIISLRMVLLALGLAAVACVNSASAQTSCPIRPSLPSEAEINECKAYARAELDQKQENLVTAASGVMLKNVLALKIDPAESCNPQFGKR